MTNKQLRNALLKKLGVTPQAISQRVQKLKRRYAMTTEDATYVIAQQEGIILDKYLDKEIIDHVRVLQQQISPPVQTLPSVNKATRQRKGELRSEQRVIVLGKEIKVTDPILPQKKILEANEMATIYPYLYILENSIREAIDHVMTSQHGDDWWDSEAPRGLRDKVTGRMADEEKNSWHQKRGARPIDYLDFDQLPALMRKIEKEVVPSIIPSLEWFTQLVEEAYKSRCVVCHMNPLDKDNIQAVKLRFAQWEKQISAKRNLIPARSS
jgi:predicted transcriptional regulator